MTTGPDHIDVLLATYQGARFVEAQIESVLAQGHPHVRLLIRDDGSTDATPAILARYAARCPQIVTVVEGSGNLGPAGNFSRLLQRAEAPYVMFCDQDNVWLPGRIGALLRRMKQLEAEWGPDRPILVHTDLTVTDEALRPLCPSFWRYQHLDPRRGSTLNRLLIQNVVTGCAAMLNRALVQKAGPIPPEAVMHDWWLALVAAAFGRLDCLPEPGVLFRQHGTNQIGAVHWNLAHVIRKAATFWDGRLVAQGMRQTQRQAHAFWSRFASDLAPAQREAVEAYIALGQESFVRRRWLLLRHGFYRTGWLRNLSLLVRV